ncbi:hypothetical protein AUK40_05020 [Candidatus Wirthbacteria bacterium CG2_30_54_11]|uniref:phosphoserine transaminase n=1 Tax=Candidatus Wirthbacteria bacterium CG2_30_54_11 TaxID=1817892 RepID=A0A1J5IYV0_9BACT|nr:MAG: hypothetical protein AUK40_05020 [Candidatus Wirthbacteria bacterium CG2_30_54_11]
MNTPIHYTVGPSQLYPTVVAHIQDALDLNIMSISHRSAQFLEIYHDTSNRLRHLLTLPPAVHIFFVGSSLESMERTIENCVQEHCFHFVDGAFSAKWHQFALELGKKAQKIEARDGEGFHLDQEIPADTELICITQNETSTGVAIQPAAISGLKDRYPDKLIAVDTVSSCPFVTLDMTKVDIMFFSPQKGFGLPAGMGVLLVSEAAVAKTKEMQKKGATIGTYHSFLSLLQSEQVDQTPETPNVLGIYLLGKVCADLQERGIELIRDQTRAKSKLIYDTFSAHSRFRPHVQVPDFRSDTVVVIETPAEAGEIIKGLRSRGIIVASGYGKRSNDQIRIANFPAHDYSDLKEWISSI